MDPSPVWLYTLSTCHNCLRAERLLKRSGRPYERVTVDLLKEDQKNDLIERLRRISPRLSFPILVADETVIVGYREAEIRAVLGKPPGRLQRWISKWFGR